MQASRGDIVGLIDSVYKALDPYIIFSKAKEASWQTFFHHSASVAAVSYRLAETLKNNLAWHVARREINTIEKRYGQPLEKLAFLLGIVHDYAKLHSVEEGSGRKKAEDILSKLVKELEISNNSVVNDLILLVPAVEGKYVPEAENKLHTYIARLVELADKLMSANSIDEAMPILMTLKTELDDKTRGAVKVGYIKASLPSLLQAKISRELIKVLEEHGWTPLVIYHDGLVIVGGANATPVPVHEIEEKVREEVSKVFGVEDVLEKIVSGLERKVISNIYSNLEQTHGKLTLGGDDPANIYHDFIVKYLSGTPINMLANEFAEVKKKRGKLLDVRRLATGLEGRGSKYFEEYLGTMLATKDSLVKGVLNLKNSEDGRKKLFLILSYMTAFASKNKVRNIIKNAFKGVPLQEVVDEDLLYAIIMAEVYKRLDNDEEIGRIVEVVYDKLSPSGGSGLEYYVSRFLLTSIKSDIIHLEARDTLKELTRTGYVNYCRICGTPLLSESIAFIEYARATGTLSGGSSEIWLHDDPPLAKMDDIATEKGTRIRFICPLCYYEAKMLSGDYKPPFLVITLHPVVAYDVWMWLVRRLTTFRREVPGLSKIEADPEELAKDYAMSVIEIENDTLSKDVKPDPCYSIKEYVEAKNVSFSFKVKVKLEEETKSQQLALIDSLGARIIIPLGADFSLKMRDVVKVLILAPRAMSIAGGGQVGLVGNLAHAYNLGMEMLPVVLPHDIPLLYNIQRAFESVRVAAKRMDRQMTPDEYSVYNMSYLVILEALYTYSIKVLAWYSKWKRKESAADKLEDYALKLLEHMSSIPYVPLALASTPPPSLDPREGDEPLPCYTLISLISRDVETHMSRLQGVMQDMEMPSLDKALYQYAKSLKEISSKEIRQDLSRHAVQKPLREAIEIIIEYAAAIGSEEARKLAREKFIDIIETTLGVDLEKQVTYRQLLLSAFNDISEVVSNIMQQLPPGKVSKFIEILLDVAYTKYKSLEK